MPAPSVTPVQCSAQLACVCVCAVCLCVCLVFERYFPPLCLHVQNENNRKFTGARSELHFNEKGCVCEVLVLYLLRFNGTHFPPRTSLSEPEL